MYLISFLLSCFEQMDTQETNVSLEESNKFQEEVVSQSKQTLLDPFPEDLEELFFEPKEILVDLHLLLRVVLILQHL